MENFQISYSKFKFILQIQEDTTMPEDKVSAFRGGIGEYMLQRFCLKERNCRQCLFLEDCAVPRFFYHPLKKKPEFVTDGESLGYVMECTDKRTTWRAGETLEFTLLLFEHTIIYFSDIMQALFTLGMHGIGKEKSLFQIIQVQNEKGGSILENGTIYNERILIRTLADYIMEHPLYKSRKNDNEILELHFSTPLSGKYQGRWLERFDGRALMQMALRRMYLLNCMGNENAKKPYLTSEFPETGIQKSRKKQVHRYSNTHQKHIYLYGITGTCQLENVREEVLPYLIAGELVHIGKNTSMGFGKYELRERKKKS